MACQVVPSCSPRRRGWTAPGRPPRDRSTVLPAQAGVDRRRRAPGRRSRGAPRAGGGGPDAAIVQIRPTVCSPRRRGWTGRAGGDVGGSVVLPAQAGVDRRPRPRRRSPSRAPRAGGGGPLDAQLAVLLATCSPRRRGWTEALAARCGGAHVLPAQAGVDQLLDRPLPRRPRAPRAGGGGPSPVMRCHGGHWCSPRRRGWTAVAVPAGPGGGVLPAQAGVDRSCSARPSNGRRAPRAGGGGPTFLPAHRRRPRCSPRRRGWTEREHGTARSQRVLPAQAGVDRDAAPRHTARPGAPRAGGGGPMASRSSAADALCSPRRRGWTGDGLVVGVGWPVLPAQAGVDRSARLTSTSPRSAPRAGGGGPPGELDEIELF